MMKTSLALLAVLLFLSACQTTRTVTLVGMTDYHSHAVPFYSDGYSQRSGVRYEVKDGRVEALQVLKDPSNPGAGYERVKPEGRYRVGTTDFQAYVAAGYKEALSRASHVERTTLDVHELLKEALRMGAP
jgi:2',3'-cyclic-nucleotide 2'-phosphodiesterase (5'-nucleotidase family)